MRPSSSRVCYGVALGSFIFAAVLWSLTGGAAPGLVLVFALFGVLGVVLGLTAQPVEAREANRSRVEPKTSTDVDDLEPGKAAEGPSGGGQ